jgi:hypothetical protein
MRKNAQDIKRELEQNWHQIINRTAKKISENIAGATPPSIFVGSYSYPNVKVGPLIPPLHGNTTVLDRPEDWIGKGIKEIIGYRLSLVRGICSPGSSDGLNVNANLASGKNIELLQELAMANKPTETEASLDKRPMLDLDEDISSSGRRRSRFDMESVQFGLTARIRNLKVSSTISVDKRIEKAFYDSDLPSKEAIGNLYESGLEISKIVKVLSVGMLGTKKNRKLVPTRWSISATDQTISANLIKKIQDNPSIDLCEVYKFSHLGNHYSIILYPDNAWSFEMQEGWLDNNGNLGLGMDHETTNGLDHYPSIAGSYFAARLSIAEHLSKIKRKSGAMVLREIHPEYVVPVGVWQIREGIREAMKIKGKKFEILDKAMDYAASVLSISKDEWIRNSKAYHYKKNQRKISDYFKG